MEYVFEKVEAGGEVVCAVKRLGNGNNGRRRPIMVTLTSREHRDTLLDKAKRLKDCAEAYKKIFMKEVVHPTVCAEWSRGLNARHTYFGYITTNQVGRDYFRRQTAHHIGPHFPTYFNYHT